MYAKNYYIVFNVFKNNTHFQQTGQATAQGA